MDSQLRIIRPAEYYKHFLEHDVRPDGRELSGMRPISVSIGTITSADGSCVIKLGNTTIMCGIKAELGKPPQENPGAGFIIPNVELTPLCSSKFRPGPPVEQAQALSQLLHECVKNSSLIDLSDLCVFREKLVWVLYADLICVDYDGNLQDASITALITALRNTVLPDVQYDEDTGAIEVDVQKKQPLNLHSQPCSTTFALFQNNLLVTDPTAEEEGLCKGEVTVVLRDDNTVCHLHKPGGLGLAESQLQQCIQGTKKRRKELVELIKQAEANVDR